MYVYERMSVIDREISVQVEVDEPGQTGPVEEALELKSSPLRALVAASCAATGRATRSFPSPAV